MEYQKKSTTLEASNLTCQNATTSTLATTKIFLGGLPSSSKFDTLKEVIEKYAEVLSIEFKTRKNSQKCLGHAVVTLKNNASDVLKNLNHFVYQERKVKITPYFTGKKLKKFRRRLRKKRIYLKNLPEKVTLDHLKGFFEIHCGKIESFYLRGEPSNKLKIGVMIFLEKGSALKAYQMYRFGEIDFEQILKLKLKKQMGLGFGFKEFKSKGGEISREEGSGCSKRRMLKEMLKSVSLVRPGRRGYKYKGDEKSSYVINVGSC